MSARTMQLRKWVRCAFYFLLLAPLLVQAQDYNGVWWDRNQSGQGVQLVHSGSNLSGAWYLYDQSGTDMWVTFVGQLTGNALQTDAYRFSGPALGTVWDINAVSASTVGTLSIQFNSATSAVVNFQFGSQSGVLNLEPFAAQADGVYSGVWWEPAKTGQGVQLLHDQNQISGAWYLYDESGADMWVTFVGNLDGDTMHATLFRFTGPPLGRVWDADEVASSSVGNLSIRFLNQQQAQFDYTLNGVSGSLQLIPFLQPDEPNPQRPNAESISIRSDLGTPYVEKQLIGTDPNNAVLTYFLLSPRDGAGYADAFVNEQTGKFYVALTGQQNVNLQFQVSNGQLFSDPAQIAITIDAVNDDTNLGRNDLDPRLYGQIEQGTFDLDILGSPGQQPTLPSAIDLSDLFPEPGSQGNQNSCVGWAVGYAIKSYHEQVENGWSLVPDSHKFSPAWIYNQINGGQDRGSYVQDALQLIVDRGAATLSTMPYDQTDFLAQPSGAAVSEANQFPANAFVRVNSGLQIKAALANRHPVVVGFSVFDSIFQLHGPNSVYNTADSPVRGGHAVTIVGYDDNRFGGAFKMINSWGIHWGDQGYFWMPYSFANQGVISEAYVLIDQENGTAPNDPDPIVIVPDEALPDLQVTDWVASWQAARSGGAGELAYAVINSGTGNAPRGAYINLMLSRNATISSSDIFVVYEQNPFELAPGESVYRDADNTIPFVFPDGIGPGEYYMAVWVDDLNTVVESNEQNNVSLGQNRVAIADDRPDLVVNSWYAEWYWDTGEGELEYDIENIGRAPTGSTTWDINFVLTHDNIVGNGDEIYLFYEDSTFDLEPGGRVYRDQTNPAYFNVYFDWLNARVAPGTYYMGIWVDDLGQVNESNELNNSSLGWDRIAIGSGSGKGRSALMDGSGLQRGRNFNGLANPPGNVLMRKVAITRGADGNLAMTMLDSDPSYDGQSKSLLRQSNRARDQVLFPRETQKAMPSVR